MQDNLNTHSEKSAIEVLGPLEGRRLWKRFEVHYTPKHGSWVNVPELEASLVARECLGRERISALVDLISSVSAWRRAAESAGRTIDWTFTVDDARRKFRYDGLVTDGRGTSLDRCSRTPRAMLGIPSTLADTLT